MSTLACWFLYVVFDDSLSLPTHFSVNAFGGDYTFLGPLGLSIRWMGYFFR